MVPIDLADHLEISPLQAKEIRLTCEGRGGVPEDERNLVYRSARSFSILVLLCRQLIHSL